MLRQSNQSNQTKSQQLTGQTPNQFGPVAMSAMKRFLKRKISTSAPLFPKPTEEQNVENKYSYLFNAREYNQVKFYSNAYDYSENKLDRAKGAFADIIRDMNKAEQHIFIVGWALSPIEKFGENNETLPQVLVKKAMTGVKIILLIWHNYLPEYWDKELAIFENELTKEINNIPNYTIQERQAVLDNIQIELSITAKLGFTHHQKLIIIDDALYIGGLDLTHGRSNPITWHDCHAKIQGSVIKDAIMLIMMRWDKVENENKRKRGMEILQATYDRFSEADALSTKDASKNGPLMRLICSINKDQATMNLFTDVLQDSVSDIHVAYCNAIAEAKHFIYMENQFLVGTRFKADSGAKVRTSKNMVICAIFTKIKEKIFQGKPFHFYCQLPLRPEGDEDGVDVQTILRKQWKTMYWLINEIKKIIGHNQSVADYVTFYNLGRCNDEGVYQMKYTHSKLLIVDDKELILGSANCNERSMIGTRDSEVAIHIKGSDPIQEITTFRQLLMQEHFGQVTSEQPEKMYTTIQDVLSTNQIKIREASLKKQSSGREPIATGWGNMPIKQLYSNENAKPLHVPDQSPPTAQLANKVANLGL